MKLGLVLRELHRSENDLAHLLLKVSDRHDTDHEIFHVGRDLAGWSRRHVRQIAEVAKEHDIDLDPDPHARTRPAEVLREKSAELLGHRGEAGMLLLKDLREIFVHASGVSVDWEMLAQSAQAARDQAAFTLAEHCHPDTLRQLRWANAQLKESSAQILLS